MKGRSVDLSKRRFGHRQLAPSIHVLLQSKMVYRYCSIITLTEGGIGSWHKQSKGSEKCQVNEVNGQVAAICQLAIGCPLVVEQAGYKGMTEQSSPSFFDLFRETRKDY